MPHRSIGVSRRGSLRFVGVLAVVLLAVTSCVSTQPVEGPSTTQPTETPDTTQAPETTEAPEPTEAPESTDAPTGTTVPEDDGEGIPPEVIWIGLAFFILILVLGYVIGRSRGSGVDEVIASEGFDDAPEPPDTLD